ncbi:MAG: LemA family protein [Planctomycetota bacterium]
MLWWLIGGFIVVLVVLIGVVAGIYNRLVRLRQRVRNGFSQIDVQLKRRHDLIPNLVETVKGYMTHEKETLERVIQARNAAVADAGSADPESLAKLAGSENLLMGLLSKLMIRVEDYPDLKASTNVSQLMEELSTTENRVAFARQAYNDSATTYNTQRQTFPTVLLAGLFGFHAVDLWTVQDDAERANPNVEFPNDEGSPDAEIRRSVT